jgi:hypothetical protein
MCRGGALLQRYGARQADYSSGAEERRADAQKEAVEAAARRQREAKALRWFGELIAAGGTGSTSSSSSSRSSESTDYTNMTVTYDQHAGSSATAGTNTIKARSSRSSYTFQYNFSGSGYLIPVGGDLTGKTINVKFVGDTPVSIMRDSRVVKISAWDRD